MMDRRIVLTFVLACSTLLPIGCRRETGTGAEGNTPAPTAAGARAEVTLHVADMTERQGLT